MMPVPGRANLMQVELRSSYMDTKVLDSVAVRAESDNLFKV